MVNFLIWILTLFFPGIIFFMVGRFLAGITAFILQATVIGWIPAIIWARVAWTKELEEGEKKHTAIINSKPIKSEVPSSPPASIEMSEEQIPPEPKEPSTKKVEHNG